MKNKIKNFNSNYLIYFYRKDFMKDMHVLAAIRDINVARIIALVEEEPFGAVFEYGELGDLPSFIKNRESSSEDAPIR